ncbi:MAG: hypothetical protein KAH20_01240 [Methylococcales bacterium]|nr:hypothetical protein [Methylococcales bacterium]
MIDQTDADIDFETKDEFNFSEPTDWNASEENEILLDELEVESVDDDIENYGLSLEQEDW